MNRCLVTGFAVLIVALGIDLTGLQSRGQPLRLISAPVGAGAAWAEPRPTLAGAVDDRRLAPPPRAVSAQGVQTIRGRLVAVTEGDDPGIVVQSTGENDTIAVTPETEIVRYDRDSYRGGPVGLVSLHAGDRVSVEVNGLMQATRIAATYRVADN